MNKFLKQRFPVFALFLVMSSTAFALPPPVRTRSEIDAYAKVVDRFVARNKKIAIALADVSDYGANVENWKKIGSWADLDKFTEKNSVYRMALLWPRLGAITAANFTFSSPSGDWNQYVNHVFRPNGSVALVASELRTFTNSCVAKQRFYFDQKGKPFLKTVRYFDLRTDRPKKPCLGPDSISFVYYKSVRDLPFSKLLNL